MRRSKSNAKEVKISEKRVCDRKLASLLAERPAFDGKIGQSQINAVRARLISGEYVDFWWAFKHCQQTQRLSAIIHNLRHIFGMPIVEWQPTEFGGSVYSLYKYAPSEIRKKWKYLEYMEAEEIKNFDFNNARRYAYDIMDGQMSLEDY